MLHQVIAAEIPRRADAGSSAQALTALERQTVQLSLADGRSSIGRDQPFARAMSIMLSHSRQNGLADPRLEALRRYAVCYRLDGDQGSGDEREALERFGYADAAVQAVEAIVRQARPFPRPHVPLARIGGILFLTAVFVVIATWLATTLEDMAVALIICGVGIVLLLSFVRKPSRPEGH